MIFPHNFIQLYCMYGNRKSNINFQIVQRGVSHTRSTQNFILDFQRLHEAKNAWVVQI